MKKMLIWLVVFAGLLFFGITKMVDFANDIVEEERKKLSDYALLMEGKLKDPETMRPQETITGVECEEIYFTSEQVLLLNKCVIDDGSNTYCYYKDSIYDCESNDYKSLYSKLDFDNLENLK